MKIFALALVIVSLFAATAFAACPCGTLSTPNSVCTLTANLVAGGTCFTVAANNVTIDCNGYTITGQTSSLTAYGVYSTRNYTKVLNCKINKLGSAVYFANASYGLIQNTTANVTTVTMVDSKGNAIHLASGSNYNTITNVTAYSKYGFGLFTDFGGNHNNVSNANFPVSSAGSSFSIRSNHTTLNGINSPQWAQIAGTYNTLTNSSVADLYFDNLFNQNGNLNNVAYGNRISGMLAFYGWYNTVYWNNFTSPSGTYVYDTTPSPATSHNYLNTTIGGKPEGNLWGNVLNGSVAVTGNVSSGYPSMALYIGTGGSGYPYTNTTAQGRIVCINTIGCAVDYAPLTPYSN
ncbi:MAG: hypothetical protein NTX79_03185 [Candidatus Micrarchaeota archaeon]|nr:hypothetical protein [Candidatus Micrarchaeota archaeon]